MNREIKTVILQPQKGKWYICELRVDSWWIIYNGIEKPSIAKAFVNRGKRERIAYYCPLADEWEREPITR